MKRDGSKKKYVHVSFIAQPEDVKKAKSNCILQGTTLADKLREFIKKLSENK